MTDPAPSPFAGSGHNASPNRHSVAILAGIALAAAATLLFPPDGGTSSPVYAIGDVAPDNVIAPMAFRVPRSPVEVQRDRDAEAGRVEAVFRFDASALDSARNQLSAFMASLDSVPSAETAEQHAATERRIEARAALSRIRLTAAEAGYLAFASRRAAVGASIRRAYERTLPAGVAAPRALENVRGGIRVTTGDEESEIAPERIGTFSTVMRVAQRLHPDPASTLGDGVYQKLLAGFFHPSLLPDTTETRARRNSAMARVDTTRYAVRAGEKIVGAHEVVGAEDAEKLNGLRDALQARHAGRGLASRIAGALLFNAAVIVIFGVTLLLYRPAIYDSPRAVLVVAGVFLLVLLGAWATDYYPDRPGTLVPVAIAALLVSMVFDSRLALIAAMVLAILVGTQAPFRGTPTLFFALVGGVTAAFSVRALRRRTQAYWSMLAIALAYGVASVAVGLSWGWTVPQTTAVALAGVLNAVASVALAMALLPTIETLCGVDTYLKLLEWSDLNHPLLRRLAVEAPGTYAHTLAMASLTEAACAAIGANALLGRVGTYFHDIGKLEKPQYFVENQPRGRNPHDKLKPVASATIIRNHVREGLALADEYKLPRSVRAFITEHHGTAPIAYFLEKARERDGGVTAGTGEFAYPGPRPQSAETAICMLADGIEAATRALSEPTPDRVREVIDRIVQSRIAQGQLNEAPLTLAQLELVKDQFARALDAMHHSRIEYPATPPSPATPAEDDASEPRTRDASVSIPS